MWNWADDYGVGSANGKQLVGFAFPNDDEITAADYPTLAAEVSECFGVVYFDHEGRPFYIIPSWSKHQRTEKKAKRNDGLLAAAEKAIDPQNLAEVEASDDSGGLSDASLGNSPLGTGEREQGNRGTGEGGSAASPPTPKCKKHSHWEHDEKCGACGRDRRAQEAYETARAKAEAVARRDAQRNPACPHGFPRHERCEKCGDSWPG